MRVAERREGFRELTEREIEMVSGGSNSWMGGAGIVLALGSAGGPSTLAFALPVALGMVAVGSMEEMREDGGS